MLEDTDSEVLWAPLGELPARFFAMPSECSLAGNSKEGACIACSSSGVFLCRPNAPEVGNVFKER